MEAKHVWGAANQAARAIAASAVVTRDRRIASVARDTEIFLASPARRPEKSSLRITKRASERGTVAGHRRQLQIARAQTREDSNAQTIAASIWKRASSRCYASDAVDRTRSFGLLACHRDLSTLIVNSISPRAYAAPGAGRCMRRFGYGTWRDPCRKDP
jgi:hypothetical protein